MIWFWQKWRFSVPKKHLWLILYLTFFIFNSFITTRAKGLQPHKTNPTALRQTGIRRPTCENGSGKLAFTAHPLTKVFAKAGLDDQSITYLNKDSNVLSIGMYNEDLRHSRKGLFCHIYGAAGTSAQLIPFFIRMICVSVTLNCLTSCLIGLF